MIKTFYPTPHSLLDSGGRPDKVHYIELLDFCIFPIKMLFSEGDFLKQINFCKNFFKTLLAIVQ